MSEDERRFCCECGFVLDYSDTNICWFCLRDGRNQDDEGKAMSEKKTVLHGKNTYNVEYMLIGFPGLANVRIGHDNVSHDEVWLYPSQALALLAWLQQEREELERLAKDEQR